MATHCITSSNILSKVVGFGGHLVNNTDVIVARRSTATLVTMALLAQAVQHVCCRLVGVELCRWLRQPA